MTFIVRDGKTLRNKSNSLILWIKGDQRGEGTCPLFVPKSTQIVSDKAAQFLSFVQYFFTSFYY